MKKWTNQELLWFVKNLSYYNIFNEEGLLALDQLKGQIARVETLTNEIEYAKSAVKNAEETAQSFRSLYNETSLAQVCAQAENDKLKEENEYLKKRVAALEFNARTDQGLD